MRLLLVLPVLLLALTACGTRQDGAAVPDRGGHAWQLAGATAAAGGAAELVRASSSPETGEGWYVFERDDRLWKVAHDHGVSLDWLIRRNDLVGMPRSGERLIVPQRLR